MGLLLVAAWPPLEIVLLLCYCREMEDLGALQDNKCACDLVLVSVFCDLNNPHIQLQIPSTFQVAHPLVQALSILF
jgi:hypothetical protein